MPFDPVFDLSPARATYELARALEIDPDDGIVQFSPRRALSRSRGMDEAALPLLERFAAQPEQEPVAAEGRSRGPPSRSSRSGPGSATRPSTKWANLSELDRVVAELLLARPGRDRRRGDRGRLPARGPPLGVGRPPGRPPAPPRPARQGPGRLARRLEPDAPPRSGRPGSPRPTSSRATSRPPASPTARPSPPTPTCSRPIRPGPPRAGRRPRRRGPGRGPARREGRRQRSCARSPPGDRPDRSP